MRHLSAHPYIIYKKINTAIIVNIWKTKLVFILRFEHIHFLSIIMSAYLWQKANSADPDQTAPQELSDQGLLCLFRLFCPNSWDDYGISQIYR